MYFGTLWVISQKINCLDIALEICHFDPICCPERVNDMKTKGVRHDG